LTRVFERVTIGVSDVAAAAAFYATVLSTLGISESDAEGNLRAWDDFAIVPAGRSGGATTDLHLAFVAPSRTHVDRFWQTGRDAGYSDAGAPGPRPIYRPDYYGSFLRDPDGNSVEAVHHGDTRRGNHLDHLWIGVSDLDAAYDFYFAIGRYTGLREGRRWDQGRQLRGAWATFSLVADGRPPTAHLRLAFPAPDPTAVDELHEMALGAGYEIAAPPGPRGDGAYACAIIDRDGTTVEAVARGAGPAR
jgi:catechol 2,3-dioxygenase-like lactoylglutathione lyase family enzyme